MSTESFFFSPFFLNSPSFNMRRRIEATESEKEKKNNRRINETHPMTRMRMNGEDTFLFSEFLWIFHIQSCLQRQLASLLLFLCCSNLILINSHGKVLDCMSFAAEWKAPQEFNLKHIPLDGSLNKITYEKKNKNKIGEKKRVLWQLYSWNSKAINNFGREFAVTTNSLSNFPFYEEQINWNCDLRGYDERLKVFPSNKLLLNVKCLISSCSCSPACGCI